MAGAAAALAWLGMRGQPAPQKTDPPENGASVAAISPEPEPASLIALPGPLQTAYLLPPETSPAGPGSAPAGGDGTRAAGQQPGQAADAAETPAERTASAEASWDEEEVEVRAGDSFSRILDRAGYSAAEVVRILDAGEEAEALTQLRPGDTLTLLHDAEGELAGVHYPVDPGHELRIEREAGAFQAELVPRDLERELAQSQGEVTGSLYRSARQAGLSDRLVMRLARILNGDIALGRDLRPGDTFSVLYERTRAPSGELLDTRLKAVRLDATGKTLEAIRFETPEGEADFYTPDGTSLTRTFNRYPVDFQRISSPFDRNRRHPILGVRRPHLGVDLAAPRGTPVHAASKGRVTERTRKGGYGRVVTLRHSARYRTRYAHLSRYAEGLRPGERVERGEVIGYVGNTGMSTGPHLHYELIINGRHRNPVTAELPRAEPLPDEHRAAFEEHADRLLTVLRSDAEEVRLAAREERDEEP